jgi:hypothetical protein
MDEEPSDADFMAESSNIDFIAFHDKLDDDIDVAQRLEWLQESESSESRDTGSTASLGLESFEFGQFDVCLLH